MRVTTGDTHCLAGLIAARGGPGLDLGHSKLKSQRSSDSEADPGLLSSQKTEASARKPASDFTMVNVSLRKVSSIFSPMCYFFSRQKYWSG